MERFISFIGLGRGGMGKVMLARHSKLGREVAIKILAGSRLADKRMRDRFDAEMQAIGQLSHPNIVTAHDAREIEGTAVLVTEYIDGADLGELVAKTGPLSIPNACEIIRKVAAALQYTSDQGFVHRDVKPSNIMVSRGGEVKLLDLGLARYESGRDIELTGTGQAIGTADYVSPEQVTDGRSVDGRSDIYSLGATLFKLLTSVAPFAGQSHQTVFAKMTAHVSETPPSLADMTVDCPPALVRLVDSMLSKDSGKRPQSSGEVARKMAQWVDKSDLVELVQRADRSTEPTRPLPVAKSVSPERWSRKPVPIAVAIGSGLIGMFLGLMLGMFIRITYPDGTVLEVPIGGAKVEIANRAESGEADAESGEVASAMDPNTEVKPRISLDPTRQLGYPSAATAVRSEPTSLESEGPLSEQIQGIWVLEQHLIGDRERSTKMVLAFNDKRWHQAMAGGTTSDPCWAGTFEVADKEDEPSLTLISTTGQGTLRYKALNDDSGKLVLQTINSEPGYAISKYTFRRVGDVSASSAVQYQAMLIGLLTDPKRPSPMKLMNLSKTELGEMDQFLRIKTKSTPMLALDSQTPAGLLRRLEGVWVVVEDSANRQMDSSAMVFAFEGDAYHAVTVRDQFEPTLSYGAIERIQKDGRGIHLVASDKVAGRSVPFDLTETGDSVVFTFDPFSRSSTVPFKGKLERDPKSKPPAAYRLKRIGAIPTSGEQMGGFLRGRPSNLNSSFFKALSMLVQARAMEGEQLLAAIGQAQEAASKTKSKNNLKQLAIAFHNFHDVFRKFPGSVNQREGSIGAGSREIKPFSWRVAVLPFIDQNALFEQYRFDEPWDSESNLKLLEQMPDVFRSPRASKDQPAGHTNYLGFATGNSALGKDDGVKIRDFLDGTSNTLLLIETKDSVPWTKPQDLEGDAEFFETVIFALADGSVREQPKLDPELLKKIITRDGNEVFAW